MSCLGNVLWLLLGGIVIAILYWIAGLLMCITIIGIPFGVQLMKFGTFALFPFGRELRDCSGETGCLSTIMNVIWILCGWWEIAVVHAVAALLLCITIVGIPFAMQHFKIAIASLFPFGKEIVKA